MSINTIKITSLIITIFCLSACSFGQSPEKANKISEFFIPKTNAGKGSITLGNNLKLEDLLSQANKRCSEIQMELNRGSLIKQGCGTYSCSYDYECIKTTGEIGKISIPKNQITIDEAKGKCQDLGFKSGSESFGKCVLRLTK